MKIIAYLFMAFLVVQGINAITAPVEQIQGGGGSSCIPCGTGWCAPVCECTSETVYRGSGGGFGREDMKDYLNETYTPMIVQMIEEAEMRGFWRAFLLMSGHGYTADPSIYNCELPFGCQVIG